MMSTRRQPESLVAPSTATAAGEIAVEEYGYGLGPPTGVLVLRYPPRFTVPDFPEDRDDFLHQIFWSPDGVIALRRGKASHFVSPTEMLWVRRGVVAEVCGLGIQTVLRICVRQAPVELTRIASAAVPVADDVAATVSALARPGVSDETALAARDRLLRHLAAAQPAPIEHSTAGAAPVQTVAAALLRDPADSTGLAEWAARLHISTKTLQREFERAHAMSFTTWRTRLRLRASVAMLARWSVTETAHRVGYASASAYVAAFTRELGVPPGSYAEQQWGGRAG